MKYFKKFPIFFTAFYGLLLAFVALAGTSVFFYFKSIDADKKLLREINSYKIALEDDPTKAAIDASSMNISKLETHLEFLEKDLTRAGADIFRPLTAKEGYQLVEQLRGFVNNWRKEARKDDIKISDGMDFGFKKYVAPNAEPPKDEAIPALWKQACVLNYINKKLFSCKTEKSMMAIVSVQREILTEEGVKEDPRNKNRRVRKSDSESTENFKIDNAITARKSGSLDTIAFRFVFAGHTDVLRRFLNKLKDFDAMLVVRSIDVRPADMSSITSLDQVAGASDVPDAVPASGGNAMDAIFGAAQPAADQSAQPAASAASSENAAVSQANRTPVVTDNISEFTVVIEYVEVVKPAPEKKRADASDAEKKN